MLAAACVIADDPPPVIGSNISVYFVNVEVLPCPQPNYVVQTVHNLIVQAGENSDAHISWLLKVMGENKVLAVVENDPEPVLERLNDKLGKYIKVTCTPVRPYENFAHRVNKIDAELCGPAPHRLSLDHPLYYVQAVVNFEGFTVDDLLTTWPKESQMMLQLRKDGLINMEFWKELGANTIHVLYNSPMDDLDDLTFTVPLVVDLGDNVAFPVEQVICLVGCMHD